MCAIALVMMLVVPSVSWAETGVVEGDAGAKPVPASTSPAEDAPTIEHARAANRAPTRGRDAAAERDLTPPPLPVADRSAKDAPVHAEPTHSDGEPASPGFLLGDRYRAPHFGWIPGLLLRTGMDVIAIPASSIHWSGADWAVVGGVVGTTAALSVPLPGGSIDVRFQNSLHSVLGPDHPRIWTPYGDLMIWTAVWGGAAGMLFYGLEANNPELAEGATLAVEAMSVAEVYHLFLKFSTGREGPLQGEGLGEYGGPMEALSRFPSGTPSGHASAIGAAVGVLTTYFNDPLLSVLSVTGGIILCTALVADDYHYLSDVIVGAAMGYAVGTWVVHHRSSHFRDDGRGGWTRVIKDSLTIAPTVTRGGAGLGLSAQF